MINLYNTEIDNLFINKIGNKCRGEELFISQDPYTISDEIRPILKEFFLKPFRSKELPFYKFSEESELLAIIEDFAQNPHNGSPDAHIAEHLYNQGNHPHIKSGELYICQLSNIMVDNYKCKGLGIFKSEIKYDFIEFNKSESRLDLILKQGVNLDKLDKGAIILEDPESKTGFKVLYIDSNKYDSKYWVENFLDLVELEDAAFHTRKYLKFCEGFAKDVVRPSEGKQMEVEFINDSLGFFAARDEFKEQDFKEEVVQDEALMNEFESYKLEGGSKYQIEDLTDFDISNETVSECRKKTKGEIVLDNEIVIKIPKGTQAASNFLEKGWDDERQMYYYLVYFNKEK